MASLNKLNDIAIQAGKIILAHYNTNCRLENKEDQSPVTLADLEANEYIVGRLKAEFPDIPIVSEEGAKDRKGSDTFFLVDPLDGTKAFINGGGQFTVNIGLVKGFKAFAGVVYIPVKDALYFSDGERSYKNGAPINCRKVPADGMVVVASKSHRSPETDEFIAKLKVKELISAESSAKFCVVAEGLADIYPRFGRTMEWDTAAGQAVLQTAGGKVTHPDGTEFLYGKNDIFENGWFVASSAV
jgi:3'(2'), 5'-bisphosphate nucleotidase